MPQDKQRRHPTRTISEDWPQVRHWKFDQGSALLALTIAARGATRVMGKDQAEPDHGTKLLRYALIGVLCIALAFIGVFGFRAVASFIFWQDEANQFQPIDGWMSPRYVVRSWQVPPKVVSDALGDRIEGGTPRTSLEEIAEARGVDVEEIIAILEAAIAAHQAKHP
ncbi:hypothetical protein [Litoreibacter halocynthiae]|uniref:hypothetical protein n=1 Tax=Litoreibacter halocynthiae TaxID=1242689 RepID=UPI00106348F5|nr:hypothetical protein [Litoreibacter halocynthiae]